MIGSAIFLVPNSVAQNLPSRNLILTIWIAAGVLSFFGALAYAELGAMMPATGGQYVYLRESFGPLWAFLCGWSFFLAARSGGIATVAAGFSIYFSYFVPLTPAQSRLVAAGLILALTWANYRGVRIGALVQNIFTALKVIGLAILIVSAFLGPKTAVPSNPPAAGGFSLSHFGVAMIACLWAYNGWYAVTLVAGEVKDPQRNLPRALMLGTALVIAMYLLANLGYLRILSVAEIAGAERVAATVAEKTMGGLGGTIVSLTILISTLGTSNGNMMTAPRLYFAQARDGLFFRQFGEIHPRFLTPSFSILGQGIWAAILALSGSYERLFSYSTFSFWVFYGMTVAGVLVLRRKRPDLERPYRMWGYPVTPIVFVVVAGWFVLNTLMAKPESSVIGVAIIAAGVPVYFLWARAGKRKWSARS